MRPIALWTADRAARVVLLLAFLVVTPVATGCTAKELSPAMSAEQAAARVREHVATEYPTGLGETWTAEATDVELVHEDPGYPPWADSRPVYRVRVVTSVEADPARPGTRVRTSQVFAVDGLDGTVSLLTVP